MRCSHDRSGDAAVPVEEPQVRHPHQPVIAAILTPTPDGGNQSLMAGPLIVLYEVGIISARIFGRRAKKPVPAQETAEAPAAPSDAT